MLKKICFFFIFFLLPVSSYADTAANVQKKYNSINTLRASFVQTLTNALTKEKTIQSGVFWFKQPLNFRWEVREGIEEILIISGDVIWNYFPMDKVAIKYGMMAVTESETMLRILSGRSDLRSDFSVSERKDGKYFLLTLFPLVEDPQMVKCELWVDDETFLLERLQITDYFGNTNEVSLSKIRINKTIPVDWFTFIPPDGVTVEDNTDGFK